MRSIVISALLAACSAPAFEPTSAELEPDAPELMIIAPRMTIAPELAEPAVAAVQLWSEALFGQYAPELTIGDCVGDEDICVRVVEEIDCEGELGGWGCLSARGIDVARDVPPELAVSTLAHEIGHSLGVRHRAEGLMSQQRSRAERLEPCIDSATLDGVRSSLGLDGEPTCSRSGVMR